jgi:hypothetical protein
MKKSNPDPKEFAREVLQNICGLRAEMSVLLQMFARHIEPDIKKADAIYVDWMRRAGEVQKKLYLEALGNVGVSPTKEED